MVSFAVEVSMLHAFNPHYESTAERCRQEKFVLAVPGAASLSYSVLASEPGLDDFSAPRKSKRFEVHAGVAVNGSGRPLGVVALEARFRRASGKDDLHRVFGLERARELAAVCPDSRVVSVCDHDGDIWKLLVRAQETGVGLVARASQPTKRWEVRAEGSLENLWAHVAASEPLGFKTVDVVIGGSKRQRSREANLTFRSVAVELIPPKRSGGPRLQMIAVSVTEEHPPSSVKEPLHWLLLTTEGAPDMKAACMAFEWYELRWKIRHFLHVLESGIKIENRDRALDADDDVRQYLASDAVTAFQVWDLFWRARTRPDAPVSEYADQESVLALQALALHHGFKSAEEPLSDIKTFAILTAGLAGFHPTKLQPLPGIQKLWEGVQNLSIAAFTFAAFRELQSQENGQ